MKPLGPTDPTAVGSFRVIGLLGGGGMGRVYLGESRSGRQVAIKIIRSELAQDETFRRRFAREVTSIRSVSPLFTAAVVEADPDAAEPWVATTYIEGPTLGELVGEAGPMAAGAVLTLAAGLADALASIHRTGLVHRDIKPSNVIINDLGPHVIDFGIALAVDRDNLTTSLLLGTPSYIAPEIIQGGDPTPASDVFSLGSTLVFAASGHHLVSQGTMHAQILRMTMGRFDLDLVPKELRPLIVRCLSPRPKDRPTADELARILVASGVPGPSPRWYSRTDAAPPVTVPPLPITLTGQRSLSRRTLLIGGGLAGAVAIGAAVGIGAAINGRSTAAENIPTPAPTPTATAGPVPTTRPPRQAGSILWTAASGTSAGGTQGGGAGGERVVVMGDLLVTATPGGVRATHIDGRPGWSQSMPAGLYSLRAWGTDAVLVTDTRTAWLIDSTGKSLFQVAVAELELAAAKADRQNQPAPEIGAVVVPAAGDRAYFGLGTATIALDRNGNRVWRQGRSGKIPVGSPLAALGGYVIGHDPLSGSGLPGTDVGGSAAKAVRVTMRETAKGGRQWIEQYTPAPFVPPAGGPPGPSTVGSGGPPGGGGPGLDETWYRVEARVGPAQAIVRDAGEVRCFAVASGQTMWSKSSITPVTSVELVGDTAVISADRVVAYSAGGGVEHWHLDAHGARIAGTLDGKTLVVANASTVSAVDAASGAPLWHTDLPANLANTVIDRITVAAHEVHVLLRAPDNRGGPLPLDVIAIALD